MPRRVLCGRDGESLRRIFEGPSRGSQRLAIFIGMGRLLVLALILTMAAATAQSERFQLFNNCKPLELVIETLSADELGVGLTQEGIKSRAVSSLRSAHLYDPDLTPSGAFLYVQVSVLGRGYVVTTELNKLVVDSATISRGFAATWDRKTIGTGARADTILGVVDEHLNDFIGQYLRVNQEAC